MHNKYPVDVEDVIRVAVDAGAAIMDKLKPGIQVDTKSNKTPVTEADMAAHQTCMVGLHAINPDIPALSEEGTPQEQARVRQQPLYWAVDPLDGTQTAIDYAQGIPNRDEFGVHIALMQRGVPVLGVAFFPAQNAGKGVLYFTGNDGKAYKQITGQPPKAISVSKPPFKEGELRVATRRNGDGVGLDGKPFIAVPGVGGQRLCLVAEGRADLANMWHVTKKFNQWDLAAGHAILRAAGGELVSAETKAPVSYNDPAFTMEDSYGAGRETLRFFRYVDALPRVDRALS